MKKLKKLPKFKSDDEAARFWAAHDSTDYVDWSKAKRAVFPNLKPTSKLISIRFPVAVLDRVKALANQRDIPYQALIKMFVNKEVGMLLRDKRRPYSK
ncbi:MAG: BrnA antitoxin family protein [Elusimicrobia bacterium]|nr:BrnA antitoxin family protein [Elusimicrobiota bacterium]